MDEPRKHYAKRKKSGIKDHMMPFIRNVPNRQIYETESRLVVAQGWGDWREKEVSASRFGASLGERQKYSEIDCGDGCTALWIC